MAGLKIVGEGLTGTPNATKVDYWNKLLIFIGGRKRAALPLSGHQCEPTLH